MVFKASCVRKLELYLEMQTFWSHQDSESEYLEMEPR